MEKTEKKQFGNLCQIEAGDEVAIEGTSGMCSGGAGYGITEKVKSVSRTEIILENGRVFSKIHGRAMNPPWCYEIAWWIKQT